MNTKHILIVLKKEFKDMFRDRKMVITSILLPLLLMPIIFTLLGGNIQKITKQIEEDTIVYFVNNGDEEAFDFVSKQLLASNTKIKVREISADDNPNEKMLNGETDLLLLLDPEYKTSLANYKSFSVNLIYDEMKTTSRGAASVVSSAISEFNSREISRRLIESGIEPSILNPVVQQQTSISQYSGVEREGTSNQILQMILPMLASVLIAVGGSAVAIDLIAGEKERNTFEALISTKANRMSILMAKYIVVTVFSIIATISQFIGLSIGFSLQPDAFGLGGGGLVLSPGMIILIFVSLLLLGMIFAGIQICLSMLAKSFKEAQTYTSLVMLVPLFIGYGTMMMQPGDVAFWQMFVPILNVVGAMKMVLGGMVNYPYLLSVILSSAVYLVVVMFITRWMFKKESLLFRA
ncbi:MAG TPA: ABC transporter permease subunit [Clostridia bacterium]|nr:ABC transporter permease subunit [Clostridia bacterium]